MNTKTPRLLMVEDNEMHIDIVQSAFETSAPEYELFIARTFRQAQDLLSQQSVDLIIADLRLPDGCGTQLFSLPGVAQQIPIIFMTGYGDQVEAVEAMKSGALDYLVKSSGTFQDMPHLVERALREWENINQRCQAEANLKHRNDLFQVLVLAADKFLREPDWKPHLPQVLETLGLAAKVCRVSVFENQQTLDGQLLASTHWSWEANDYLHSSAPPTQVEWTTPALEEWRATLAQGHSLVAEKSTITSEQQSLFGVSEIGSLVIMPVMTGATWWGGVSFERCCQHHQHQAWELDALRSAANILSSAIVRQQFELEQKIIQAQVQQTQKLESLGVMTSGIAHDFNNMLVAILGNVSLLLEDLPEDSTLLEYAQVIKQSAKKASCLCRQMLTYAGKNNTVIEPVSLDDLIKEMVPLLKVSVPKKVVLDYALDPTIPSIQANRVQLCQIVLNLVLNAAEAIGNKNGTIEIRTGRQQLPQSELNKLLLGAELCEGEFVWCEVRDNGCGMNEETIGKIFNPFFTTKSTGRGLGMSVVLGIVQGLSGAIQINSVCGQGTQIKVLFAMNTRAVQGVPLSETAAQRGTVLVADDEAFIQRITERTLKQQGFRVLVASNGVECVELFRAHHQDIVAVILDVAMPEMNGEEACLEIRKIRSDVPVIVSTGFSEQEVHHRFQDQTIEAFLPKPYEPNTMVERLLSVVTPARLDGALPLTSTS